MLKLTYEHLQFHKFLRDYIPETPLSLGKKENTLVDIVHELLRIRSKQLSFSCVDFDVYDADDFTNCIARSL